MSKAKMIPVTDLKVTWYVRRQLDQDNVLRLAELYAAGVDISPLEVTEDLEIIDGRHRKEAAELADIKELPCVILKGLSGYERITESLRANCGGALPASREDIQYSIEQMIVKHGLKRAQIIKQLTFLPGSVIGKYVDDAMSHLNQIHIKNALDDIAERGLSITQAANLHGIDPETLRRVISGKGKRKRANVAGFMGTLSNMNRGNSQNLGRLFVKMLRSYEDREIPEETVKQVFAHARELLNKQVKVCTQYEGRFRAMQSGEMPELEEVANG